MPDHSKTCQDMSIANLSQCNTTCLDVVLLIVKTGQDNLTICWWLVMRLTLTCYQWPYNESVLHHRTNLDVLAKHIWLLSLAQPSVISISIPSQCGLHVSWCDHQKGQLEYFKFSIWPIPHCQSLENYWWWWSPCSGVVLSLHLNILFLLNTKMHISAGNDRKVHQALYHQCRLQQWQWKL